MISKDDKDKILDLFIKYEDAGDWMYSGFQKFEEALNSMTEDEAKLLIRKDSDDTLYSLERKDGVAVLTIYENQITLHKIEEYAQENELFIYDVVNLKFYEGLQQEDK